MVFQLLQALLNVVTIVSVVTPQVLGAVYSATSPSTLLLVCSFCFIWGFGTLGFGMGIKMLGMAVGTSVVRPPLPCMAIAESICITQKFSKGAFAFSCPGTAPSKKICNPSSVGGKQIPIFRSLL